MTTNDARQIPTTIPDAIRVGEMTYTVTVDDAAMNTHAAVTGQNLGGLSQVSVQRIVLAQTDPASGLPLGSDYQRSTLLHEILHTCLRASACDPDQDAAAGLKDVEERAVAAIAGPLLATLRDHPDLVAYLCDRRAGAERDITAGASADIAHTEPHRTDSDLAQRIGFTPPPPDGVWVTHRHDGASSAVHPDEATARRVAQTGAGEEVRFLPYGACLTDVIRSARRSA